LCLNKIIKVCSIPVDKSVVDGILQLGHREKLHFIFDNKSKCCPVKQTNSESVFNIFYHPDRTIRTAAANTGCCFIGDQYDKLSEKKVGRSLHGYTMAFPLITELIKDFFDCQGFLYRKDPVCLVNPNP